MRRLIRGKGPLWLAGVLCALATAIIATPWALRTFNYQEPTFSPTEVRCPSFVPPYPAPGTIDAPDRVIAWEATGREEYVLKKRSFDWIGAPYENDRFEERPFHNGIDLPGGHHVRFLGGGLWVQGQELPVFFDSEFRPADRKHCSEIPSDPQGGPHHIRYDEDEGLCSCRLAPPRPKNEAAFFRVHLIATTEFWGALDTLELRDARTGYRLAVGRIVDNWRMKTDNPGEIVHSLDFRFLALPTGPVSFVFEMLGESKRVFLPPISGAQVEVGGEIAKLYSREDLPERPDSMRRQYLTLAVVISSDRFGNNMDRPPSVAFHELPPVPPVPWYVPREAPPTLPSRIEEKYHAGFFEEKLGRLYTTQTNPEELFTICVQLNEPHTYAIVPMPKLDAFFPAQPEYANLLDRPMPSVDIDYEWRFGELLSATLQTSWSGGLSELPAPSWPPGALRVPFNTGGITAREYFDAMRARYGDHVVSRLVYQDANRYVMLFDSPGRIRRTFHPKWSWFLDQVSNIWRILAVLGGLLGAIKLWALIQAKRLHDHLRLRGYKWMGFFQAEALYLLLGRRAWRIPAYEELGAVPGVDPDNVASIARVMREAEGEV